MRFPTRAGQLIELLLKLEHGQVQIQTAEATI